MAKSINIDTVAVEFKRWCSKKQPNERIPEALWDLVREIPTVYFRPEEIQIWESGNYIKPASAILLLTVPKQKKILNLSTEVRLAAKNNLFYHLEFRYSTRAIAQNFIFYFNGFYQNKKHIEIPPIMFRNTKIKYGATSEAVLSTTHLQLISKTRDIYKYLKSFFHFLSHN